MWSPNASSRPLPRSNPVEDHFGARCRAVPAPSFPPVPPTTTLSEKPAFMSPKLLTAIALLVSSVPALAQSRTPDIQAQENRWARAFNTGDLDRVANLYADDAWLILPGAPAAKGREEIRNALGEMAKHARNVQIRVTAVQPLGKNFLVENGIVSFENDDGARKSTTSNYQVIWQRDRHGRWRIVRDIGSPLQGMISCQTENSPK